jgi:hypothetical protein
MVLNFVVAIVKQMLVSLTDSVITDTSSSLALASSFSVSFVYLGVVD